MIHPHIPRQTDLAVRLSHNGFTATLTNDDLTVIIALPTGKVERTLNNIFLHIASQIPLPRIASHFNEHTNADPHCPCCKLEGRVLSSMGRRSVSGQAAYASRPAYGGKVEVRHIRTGLSGAQIIANDKRSQLFEAAKSNPKPQKIVKQRIEDLI